MPNPDLTYRSYGDRMTLHPQTPAAAGWLAKYSTTNITDSMEYTADRAWEIIRQMREDGLTVTEDRLMS